MTDPHENDDTERLSDPIKVKWQGDSRVKYETRTLEPYSGKWGDVAEFARRANARHKTQLTIKTVGELEATVKGLKKHIEFCGPYGAHWATKAKEKAAKRVLFEIESEADKRGIVLQ